MAKHIIRLDKFEVEEVAYRIVALADSNDPDERKRLADTLLGELGIPSEAIADAHDVRREVIIHRQKRRLRELRQRAIERRRRESGELSNEHSTIDGE